MVMKASRFATRFLHARNIQTHRGCLQLHGSHLSTCSERVKVIAYEKGIELEVVPVNFAVGEHKSAAYLEKQPFGQIPYLDDDGFIVYESRAISRYLATKFASQGTKLLPDAADLKESALFEQGASIELSNFDPFASGLVAEKVFNPMKGIPTDEGRFEWLVTRLRSKLEGYERILSKQKYLVGNEISAVDLFHLPYGDMANKVVPGIMEEQPHVAAWWKDISSRDSWKRVLEDAEAAKVAAAKA
ncbi:hypothetical protein FRB99_003680 [Tulasnella sp. 403]|nr:hypothetical protein FRB99_003680 [Tulasnella sp. 403]